MNFLFSKKPWLKDFLQESQEVLRFSFPIMFCKVGFMTLGIVDAVMIGDLGVNELAGSGVARAIFLPLSVFFMGILFSVDVFASHAMGANRKNDLEKILFSGMQGAFFLSVIFFILTIIFAKMMWFLDVDENVSKYAEEYLFYLSFGTPFLVFNLSMQRFLLGQKIINPFIVIIVLSNVLNYYLNRALIFGEYGCKAYGVAGAAMATNLSRVFVFFACIAISIYYFRVVEKNSLRMRNLFHIEKKSLLKMFWFGIPSGGQRVFEVALFSLLTLFSTRLTVAETAAHHVAMLILNFCHNFPLALSSTAAFRIGGFIGKNQMEKAKIAGSSTIVWGTVFMALNAAALIFFPLSSFGIFTKDPAVISAGSRIALLVGFCLILDGLQGCTIGVLRGAGDNKFSFYASIIGYYPIALLFGFAFCFWFHWGLTGLWVGLVWGFVAVSLLVFFFWANFKPKLILISADNEAS